MIVERQQRDAMRMKQLMIDICHYLEDKYLDEIKAIITNKETNLHFELDLDLLDFLYHFPFEGSKFHEYPKEFLKFIKQMFFNVQQKLIQCEDETFRQFLFPKKHLDIRLINVPPLKEIYLDTIRNLRQYHINKFMVIQGTVIRSSNNKNRETKKDFACKFCGKIYRATSDIYEYTRFLLPPVCGGEVERKPNPFYNMLMAARKRQMANGQNPGPMFQGTTIGQCNGKQFVPINGTAQYKDYQEIKIQEVYKTLKPGVIPRSTIVIFEDDLVDRAKPGDDVMISGIFIQRWRSPFNRTERPEIEVAFLANHVIQLNKRDFKKEINKQVYAEIQKFWKSHERNPIEGKNEIIESICPHIYERYPEKLGVLLCVIGGVQKQHENDPRIRGQIHMLMIGEPGTGKSQLLSFASKISMRSVMTTGIGTTSAGLTVALFKDGNEYILEAGALVLADFGVCCIDEFSLIRPEDRGSIHEAMEQQTISIAKGGITCKINSRATIIAATNPCKTQKWNSRYDNNQNTGIATSLLSRFDMVFILVDECITEQDLAQANFIYGEQFYIKLSYYLKTQIHPSILSQLWQSRGDEEEEVNQKIWSIDKLSKYIVYVQRYIDPVCTEKAEMIIQAYFQYLRNLTTLGKDRKTVRMLESLIRLAEAHARLMNKNDIDIYDAISVIILMEHCVSTGLYQEIPPVIMSRQLYEKAKYETLIRLGLELTFFDDEFDQMLADTPQPHQRPNNMGDETAFNMMETYYNLDKTESTHAAGKSQKTSVNGKSVHDVKSEIQEDSMIVIDSNGSDDEVQASQYDDNQQQNNAIDLQKLKKETKQEYAIEQYGRDQENSNNCGDDTDLDDAQSQISSTSQYQSKQKLDLNFQKKGNINEILQQSQQARAKSLGSKFKNIMQNTKKYTEEQNNEQYEKDSISDGEGDNYDNQQINSQFMQQDNQDEDSNMIQLDGTVTDYEMD